MINNNLLNKLNGIYLQCQNNIDTGWLSHHHDIMSFVDPS